MDIWNSRYGFFLNPWIWGKLTKVVHFRAKSVAHFGRNFQRIENQLRPKFAYGFTWDNKDMKTVQKCYETIENICLEKLGDFSDE